MRSVLSNYPHILSSIVGLGLGSHDLMTFLNAKHTAEQLDFPRKELLYLAKAYDLLAIDIASMNISNREFFIDEVSYGVDNGYDGKFIIHPAQLSWLQQEMLQNKQSLTWAKNILRNLPENYNGEDIVPFVLNGEVVEKPHALKAVEIIRRDQHGK